MFLRCAYFELLYILLPLFLIICLYRWKFHRSPLYCYPLSDSIAQEKLTVSSYFKTILNVMRAGTLLGLIFLITRPQWVDERSRVNVEGIDTVLAVDVSASMQFFDDLRDRRSRITVAKQEAIRFIEKRTNDPIGVVLFGKEALSRCPLTLDKKILKEIIGSITLGEIDAAGTWLGTGLATAVSRLKNSKSKSKIIILLTDGEPTPPEKIEVDTAIQLAKQFGVKVYTIGIGNERGGYMQSPFMGLQQMATPMNPKVLETIAEQTGGMFFRAQNAAEMRSVYNKIDALEKTEYETDLFHRYYEAFLLFIWVILGLLAVELILKLLVWRGVW